MAMSSDTLVYIVNHLFLPPRLPQSDDHAIERDLSICDVVINSAQAFEAISATSPVHPPWTPIIKMLTGLRALHMTPSLDKREVQKLMIEVQSGDNLIIPVMTQNACVIVRRLEGSTVYESFEIDPPNAEVMGTKGRLIRSFPGPAHEVADTESTTLFQAEFASFLANMDVGDVDSTPISVKAKSEVKEIRDTSDPHYITRLLTAIIHGLPDSQSINIERVEKHVRNEIMWNKAYKPWRRSPLWLIIRVAIQTTLVRLGGSHGQLCYKAFMISLFADILLVGDCRHLSTDLLVCLGDKLARRLRKLSEVAPELISKATSAIEKTNAILRERWDQIRRGSDEVHKPLWAPQALNISADTHLSLLSSKDYLSQRLQQSITSLVEPEFRPSEFPRIIDDVFHTHDTKEISAALAADPYVALADIEQFAQERLDSWVQTYRFSVSACVALGKCLALYAETAKTKYAGNPEDQSLMLLTIFQLWSALDQLAISQLPILEEYSPEIPESLLEPLLLRKAESIQGLVRFHQYLERRHNRACQGSIFTDELTQQSFAICYFDGSDELALLKQEIEEKAHAARDAKLKELENATATYKSLKQQAGSMDHKYGLNGGHRRKACQKYAREKQADHLTIAVHEWPLPQDILFAKAVVFELRCPDAFQTWRTATYTILFDVCRPGLPILETKPKVETTLKDYAGLKQFCRSDLSGVTYASTTKSFMKSHYSSPRVADTNRSSVLVHNALTYHLFDDSHKRWVVGSFSDCSVKPLCTFKLPSASPYFALQYAVDGTTHSANQPIAEQTGVPPELDLQEHIAFGTLRSGAKLQWLNIVRELRARTLSFHQHDVQLLLIQAALQVGPINGHEVEWHQILRNSTFGVTLLHEVDDFLSSIEGNWRNIAALQTFIILIGRLLAAVEEDSETVVDFACYILWRVRNIAYTWMHSLLDDLKKATDDTNSNAIRIRICAAAATCRAAYDVDFRFLDRVFSENGDVELFIQCSVHILDCTPPGQLPDNLEYLLARDRRSSQSLAPFLWEKIRVDSTSLNNSVLAVWSSFTPSSKPWKRLFQPNDRWLMSMTTGTFTDVETTVHLNLFDGSLLINGKPVGRLPSAITSHPTYVRLLGQKTFNVIPSVLPNMDFATRNLVFGDLSLHFKLTEPGGNLIIQAKCGVDLYELIPHTAFNNAPSGPDLPFAFLENYAHWLQLYSTSDKSSGHVEFHPLQSTWRPSQDNWCLHFRPSGSKMQHSHSLFMVDIRSLTCEMVSRRLQPLEVREHVHVVLNVETSRLSADLPRYKLSFFLNDSQELESKTIRDMVVDSDQSTGTMFGLADQLVLKAVNPRFTNLALPGSRSVIIPFGDVSSQTSQLHAITRIPLDNHIGLVKYFKYDVDLILGRLVGTTLLSDLYKIYLHACTSFPLPDPLTNRTGTEEALKELDSANCLSFQKLSAEELEVLHKISDLSPILEWYPKHLRVMQTIHWHKIGPLAQHWAFNARVQAILQFHQTLNSLEMEDTQKNLPNPRESHLLTRFLSRTFRLYRAVEDIPLFPSDERYPSSGHLTDSRSSVDNKNGFKIASDVSALVQKMPSRLKTVPDLWTWLNTSDLGTFENDDRTISLSYKSDFLHPSLSRLFVPVYNRCREGQALQTMTELTFTLPAIAYNSPRHVDLLPTLLAFNTLSSIFRDIDPPRWESYDLSFGVTLDGKMLDAVIEKYPHPLSTNPQNRHAGETEERFLARQKASHAAQIKELVNDLVAQWPCEAPFIPNRAQFSLIDVGSKEMKAEITELFQHWFKNMHFRAYVDRVQVVLNNAHLASSSSVPSIIAPYEIQWSPSSSSGGKHRPTTLDELLVQRDPPALVVTARAELPPSLYSAARNFASQSPPGSILDPLVEEFTGSPQVLHRHYGRALDSSLKSYLAQQNVKPLLHHPSISFERLHHDHESGRRDSESILDSIKTALAPVTAFEEAENLAGQWPQVTARSLLALLSEKAKSRFNEPIWIARIVLFAQSLVRLQRTQRLLRLKLAEDTEGLIKELGDDQFEKDILCHPTEWLLIQIDGDFAVRPIQMRVAQEMISPSSNQNTLLQLNMGEGKSSVIVPLVSATLASGDKIIRVVVLKPLANQMFQLLVRRLSGLANRRIFYLPFSRDFKPTLPRLTLLQSVYETCMREGGVLLVQPEHILSFKLMGVDLAAGACGDEVTDALLASQRWLTSMSRDVLDESDEILSVIYQLVYTSGIQEPLENHPDRWIIIQEILDYAKKHAQRLHEENPAGLDVKETRAGEFPIIRILEPKAGGNLIRSIAEEMALSERLSRLPQAIRQAAWDFVTCSGSGLDTVESSLKSTGTWPYLLLCRGFVGHGLLRFIFQEKRWRVDYGLDPTRTLLAVPYRAKDVPSLRADFGHPDVAIALTCLSYYYGGLTEEQLETTFQLLFKLDDPESEYKAWVAFRVEVPDSLREIIGVNLEDQQQWKTMLIPLFYRNQAVINFYLSSVVFPKDAKQFPRRFATSSWDLAETKPLVTTGFSGTNDSNRYLLPTSVKQRDPLNQLGTNAQVLSYLLRPENAKYMCLHHEDQPLSSCDFLDLVVEQKPPLRVLLDVGAQMLDMKSTEIASRWIELVPEIQAVVFFDEADKLVVMSRDHTIEHLVSSQFSQKLDLCAIYLDDAHTRGTDLKLPKHFRAAVTLGPRLTKDRLVQGCMRMRLLGVGQSVMFFAPPEVDRVIRERGHIPPAEKVEVVDILRWVMQETCRYIQHHLSHWAQQGVEYKRRKDAWDLYESQDSTQVSRQRLRSSWEEPDARSLEELYAPPPNHQSSAVHPAFQIPDLKQRLDDLGVSSLENPEMDEEHEREVSHEAERERQIDRPERARAALSSIQPNLRRLIADGTFNGSTFVPLFYPPDDLGKLRWCTELFSTMNFATTITGGKSTGYYLRPVNWILSVTKARVLVALSPYEVNELLPQIQKSKHVHLHIYSPRVNQARRSFEDLTFFSIPALPPTWSPFPQTQISQLNLWAGQLYLKDHGTYKNLCLILGIVSYDSTGENGHWETGGFIEPKDRRGLMAEECKLEISPLPFLKELISSRRKGMNYSSTHWRRAIRRQSPDASGRPKMGFCPLTCLPGPYPTAPPLGGARYLHLV